MFSASDVNAEGQHESAESIAVSRFDQLFSKLCDIEKQIIAGAFVTCPVCTSEVFNLSDCECYFLIF
jgi:hypothetical protein